MLGLRLSPEVEKSLDRYARDVGRSKSVIVRDWIVEGLERDSIDGQLRHAARILAAFDRASDDIEGDLDEPTSAWLRHLDAEDGGYDWGPDGPPAGNAATSF